MIFLIVFSLIVINFKIELKSFFVNITSDESIAMSVPLCTLTPMSLLARAGLSFIPSPHIITLLLDSFKSFMISAFSDGRTLAITFVIPSSLAIFSAVDSLSPVSIIVCICLSFNFFMTSFAFERIMSLTPISPIISEFFIM